MNQDTPNPKELLGSFIASQIIPESIIAVGTGSTVDAVIRALGNRMAKERFGVTVVPTSMESAALCAAVGCTVLSLHAIPKRISWGFDGADEIDDSLRLIKGRGGALLREKIIASHCESLTILADDSKLVSRLGERFAVPIEIVPEALTLVRISLRSLGATEIELRSGLSGKHGPAITESGNLIVDARFDEIDEFLPHKIKSLVGVVEHGIFVGLCDRVVIASSDGKLSERRSAS